ncbi:MAG TPA: hypothetical protein VHK24_12545 [Steroidobacter sp.]|nr:hypothetical protein [Steroidobacter sp.]
MRSFMPVAALAALTSAILPSPGNAADEIATLRAEFETLKIEYADRVTALEARIEELESASAGKADSGSPPRNLVDGQNSPSDPQIAGAQEAPPSTSRSTASAFNPAISLILGGTFVNTSEDPRSWRLSGFTPSDGEVGPGERSFNLDESELAVSANVDPYFTGTMIAALSAEDEIEVEEAYVRTLALPSGFTAKAGRFFSGLGYLNEVHRHAWDFIDQPFAYQVFFGGQYTQNGVQVKWLAPTDLFIELGAESGNGETFPATRRNATNGGTFFVHFGGDLGDSTSWRAGASYMDVRAADRAYEDSNQFGSLVVDSFTGKSRTWAVDAVLKWSPYGDLARRQLKVQGEYMHRREDGQLAFDVEALNLSDAYRSEQSGWYLQTVFQFLPRWRVGLRYDALDSGSPNVGLVSSGQLPPDAFPLLRSSNPERISLMFDWNPSEFSRLRAQYDWDDARAEGDRDRIFRLQYIFGIGAHGAHKY